MQWILSFTLGVCLTSAALAELPVPRAAKDFRIAEPSGKALSINDYRGKVVVVQFLYTTCPHCQATARMLTSLAKEFGPASLQVVGVAFNDEAESGPSVIEAFSKSNQIGFPVGSASRQAVLNYLGISIMERFVVPQIVIIDRKGSIRAQTRPLGTPELQDESYLRTLLGELLSENGSGKEQSSKR